MASTSATASSMPRLSNPANTAPPDDGCFPFVSAPDRGHKFPNLCDSGKLETCRHDLLHLRRFLREPLTETLQVLGQQLLELSRVHVILILKKKMHEVAAFLGRHARANAERLDPAQVELPLFADEAAIEGLATLGGDLGPGVADPGDVHRDRQAVLPVDL